VDPAPESPSRAPEIESEAAVAMAEDPLPAEPVAEQPAEPLAEQPAEPLAEQPAEPVAEQLAEPLAEPAAEQLAADTESMAQPADELAEAGAVVELAPGAADPSPEAAVSWDQFDDPEFDPTTMATAEVPTPASLDSAAGTDGRSAAPTMNRRGHTVVLGPRGVDGKGVIGRIHQVVRGDTLWDISEAYLGTPWVWPSVWKDNRKIENPHLINPGDHIWITSNEMRPVSPEEASRLMAGGAGQPASGSDEMALMDEGDGIEPNEDLLAFDVAVEESFPADALDQLPIVVPGEGGESRAVSRTIRVSSQKTMGFINDEELKAASSILDSPSERIGLSILDTVYLGLGEGEVSPGDRFTIFRSIDEVKHPGTHRLLGYYIDVVGWLEVVRIEGQTSVATIKGANAAILRGDHVIARIDPPLDVDVLEADEGLEGTIVYLPSGRTLVSTTDYVFLDVGAAHGVEIGTDMEVYEPGRVRADAVKGNAVRTPDRIIADLIVVNVEEESSVAYVNQARRGLNVGDAVRGATELYSGAF
jgi:nucleoid-associated protein YgaU